LEKQTQFQQICLAILKRLKLAQAEGALDNVSLRLGPYTKQVNLKIPVAFIIGDAQGGDYIVGRPPYYDGRKAKRICRTCNAGPEQVDQTRPGMCRRLIQSDVEELMCQNKTDELKAMYQSTCPNAFFDLDYGGSPFGIFTAACPTEGLHQMEKEIILDCLNELFKNHMSTIMKSKLDAIVISWCALPNQQFTKAYMDVYPRLHF
jgi:hypothetical protein